MKDPTASQLVRLKFIEARIIERGSINRADIERVFKVNTPTASRDFKRYLDSGGHISFVPQRSQYERRRYFAALYFKTGEEASEWLFALNTVYGIFTL
jgi:hypothetical protein